MPNLFRREVKIVFLLLSSCIVLWQGYSVSRSLEEKPLTINPGLGNELTSEAPTPALTAGSTAPTLLESWPSNASLDNSPSVEAGSSTQTQLGAIVAVMRHEQDMTWLDSLKNEYNKSNRDVFFTDTDT